MYLTNKLPLILLPINENVFNNFIVQLLFIVLNFTSVEIKISHCFNSMLYQIIVFLNLSVKQSFSEGSVKVSKTCDFKSLMERPLLLIVKSGPSLDLLSFNDRFPSPSNR